MTDVVNAYFRRFYPADYCAWKMEASAGIYMRRYAGDSGASNIFPEVLCADGFRMSVQGHASAHSYPRDDFADLYDQVEIMAVPGIPHFAFYDRECNDVGDERIYPYVPVEMVAACISDHGGLFDWNAADLGPIAKAEGQ